MHPSSELMLKSSRHSAREGRFAAYHKRNNDWKRDILQRSTICTSQTDAGAAVRQQDAEQIQQRASQRAIDDEL